MATQGLVSSVHWERLGRRAFREDRACLGLVLRLGEAPRREASENTAKAESLPEGLELRAARGLFLEAMEAVWVPLPAVEENPRQRWDRPACPDLSVAKEKMCRPQQARAVCRAEEGHLVDRHRCSPERYLVPVSDHPHEEEPYRREWILRLSLRAYQKFPNLQLQLSRYSRPVWHPRRP